jgi:hypothetical protein
VGQAVQGSDGGVVALPIGGLMRAVEVGECVEVRVQFVGGDSGRRL